MTSENLQRSTYRDPTAPGNPVRSGSPSRAENALDMDQYYRPLERIHGSSLHGWGVACGLSVTASLTSPNAPLTVLPGVAVDSSGRHIALAAGGNAEIGSGADQPGATPTLVPVAATGVSFPIPATASGDKYLTMQFWETFDSDGFQNLGTFRYFHTPWLRLVDVAGFANDGSRLVLAKVSLGTGATAGQVTALSADVRQGTDLPVGSLHLLTSSASSAAQSVATVQASEAGVIRASSGGGLEVTVPNAGDEIQLQRDDGGNFATLSLGAEKIVARQGTGTESVVIDTPHGNISATGGVTAGGSVTATSLAASGPVTAGGPVTAQSIDVSGSISASGGVTAGGSITASAATINGPISASSITASTSIDASNTTASTFIRQNALYMSGGAGWSSLSYNAHHNSANNNWVFPNPTHAAVTIEMDDAGGTPRFQVWSTTPGNPTGWVERFAIDGNTGNTWVGGNLSISGQLFGRYGDASQAHWAWLWAQNSIAAFDITLPNPQPLFTFIALTSINHFQVQPSGTGNFAYITGVDGGNPFGRPIGDPANSVWSGVAQRISFRLQSTLSSQAWAVAVVFSQQA